VQLSIAFCDSAPTQPTSSFCPFQGWFCDSAVTYREMACRCSAVSEDGSALALAFGRSVVLCGCDDVADLDLLTSHSQDIT